MVIEAMLNEIQSGYDWSEVFGEGDGGNCTRDVESLDGTSESSLTRSDIAEVIASVNGENDVDEWICVVRLKDGRYCAACGSCDYTGWDCQAGNTISVASTLANVVRYGLTDYQAGRLGLASYRSEQQCPSE